MANEKNEIIVYFNRNSVNLVLYLGVEKPHKSKALMTVTSCSNYQISNKDENII